MDGVLVQSTCTMAFGIDAKTAQLINQFGWGKNYPKTFSIKVDLVKLCSSNS